MKILFFLLLYLSTVSTVIVISPLLQKLLRNECLKINSWTRLTGSWSSTGIPIVTNTEGLREIALRLRELSLQSTTPGHRSQAITQAGSKGRVIPLCWWQLEFQSNFNFLLVSFNFSIPPCHPQRDHVRFYSKTLLAKVSSTIVLSLNLAKVDSDLHPALLRISDNSINLLAFYHECRSLVGYATRSLFIDR